MFVENDEYHSSSIEYEKEKEERGNSMNQKSESDFSTLELARKRENKVVDMFHSL